MHRRSFLAGAASAALAGYAQQSPRTRPNILFLLTDDQRWDTLGCMGNAIIQTPEVDSLARDGVLFRNAFVTTAICAVSRASIFSGQYERTHRISSFDASFTPEQFRRIYPAVLRANGYRTGFIGKWGVGNIMPSGEFDYWKGFPGQGRYNVQQNGKPAHLTNVMADQAVEFLDGGRGDQPFCLSISFKAPHAQDQDMKQYLFDPALARLYRDVTIPIPKTADESYFRELPQYLRDSEGHRRWGWRFATPVAYQEAVKGYYRLITGVDRAVTRIRKELAARGLAENTVIIYTGDNGYFLGERGLADKWYMFEESIRVPLIVYDPRLPAAARGKERTEMALNIDLAPTMLELAGLPAPESMQGRTLGPLIRGERVDWRKEWYYSHLFNHPQIPKSEGVRTEQWAYFRFPDADPAWELLYDVSKDPLETKNLVKSPEHARTAEHLRARCAAWKTELENWNRH